MKTYFVIVTCRNSEKIIEDALTSLVNQTLKPQYIIVIDDGSTDKTAEKLDMIRKNVSQIHVITNPDQGYNIGRVVSNWNKAITYVEQCHLPQTDYHMISTDDTVYEEDYAEKLLEKMEEDPKIAIASGNYGQNEYITPHGAGRFIKNSFFEKNHHYYPEKMGYESLVLHSANKHGYTCKLFNEARFRHTRQLGRDHQFYEFGASMRTLGYHPLFVLGRFFLYFINGRPIGRKGAIYMLFYYLRYKPKKEGYDSMYDPEIRKFIRNNQCQRMKNLLRGEFHTST